MVEGNVSVPVTEGDSTTTAEEIKQQAIADLANHLPEGSSFSMEDFMKTEAKNAGATKQMRHFLKIHSKKMTKRISPLPSIEEAAAAVYGVIRDSIVETATTEESPLSQTELSLYTGRKFLSKPTAEELCTAITVHNFEQEEMIRGLVVRHKKAKKTKGKPTGHSLVVYIPEAELIRQKELLSERAAEKVVIEPPVAAEEAVMEREIPTE